MSIRELLEEGDTGEALLPCRPKWAALLDADESVDQAKVNDQGVHADRDGSEAPRPETPSTEVARDRDAEESIPAVPDREHIVTVPRERVEAFREWLSRPSGSFSAGPRLTFEAVEGGTFWVRTRPWRLKP